MKKFSGRSSFSMMALWVLAFSGLSACDPNHCFSIPLGDPAYTIPVEVNLSERFLAAWDAGYPMKVSVHFDAPSAPSTHVPDDYDVGVLCSPPSGHVYWQRDAYVFASYTPGSMSITASVVPYHEITQSECVARYGGDSTDGGMTDGGVTAPPRGEPVTPKPEWTQTMDANLVHCGEPGPSVFSF